jgi:hypothetical protein
VNSSHEQSAVTHDRRFVLRIGDCRRTDTIREFIADRSRAFIGSTPFTPFWRVCRKAFLTAPYKNCTLQDHNSANISASLPEHADGRTSMARTSVVHDQISIAIVIEASSGANNLAAHHARTCAAIVHGLRSNRGTH